MRKLITTLAVAAVVALPLVSFAGGSAEYPCTNGCPLAKQANTRRSSGEESMRASGVVRADVAGAVAKNLDRI